MSLSERPDQVSPVNAVGSPADVAQAQAHDSLAKQIYNKPTTDFHFADGRTRQVIYGPGGVVEKISDSGNIDHLNHLNGITEWDRLGNGTYMGVTEKGNQPSTFTQADTVQVQTDGSIVLNLNTADRKERSALLRPDGTDSLTITDKSRPGYRNDFLETADGSIKDKVVFADGTKLTLLADENAQRISQPRSMLIDSNGGTLSVVKTDKGASWEAKDPAGKTSKGIMTEAEFKDKFQESIYENQLSIDWYKAGPEGARYDVVTDDSGLLDSIQRELKHMKDSISR